MSILHILKHNLKQSLVKYNYIVILNLLNKTGQLVPESVTYHLQCLSQNQQPRKN